MSWLCNGLGDMYKSTSNGQFLNINVYFMNGTKKNPLNFTSHPANSETDLFKINQ